MTENPTRPSREDLFKNAERKLHFAADVYQLGSRFEGLNPRLADVYVLDVTRVPGCHYGLRNVFVPIIHDLENKGLVVDNQTIAISPETAILVEPSTGNGWVAFSDAAEKLGYEHVVIMPDGLPEARYRHPSGKGTTIIKTPAQDYALGMPRQLKQLIKQNPERLGQGEKIYVSPNHPVGAADITVKAMSELGKQLLDQIQVANPTGSLTVVVSMGNGASLCALGEYVKEHVQGSRVIATESFVYGGGYDQFAQKKGLPLYKDLYGIDPGNSKLMQTFAAYGTNAPIGIELPLQTRAMAGNLIDEYVLFTDSMALSVFETIEGSAESIERVRQLPNYSTLPQEFINRFGNSSLANIATASLFTGKGELVVAMVYDGRGNYQ